MCVCVFVHTHPETVNFITVNLKEIKVKKIYFYHIFFQIDYDKLYIFRMYVHIIRINKYIYILDSIPDYSSTFILNIPDHS